MKRSQGERVRLTHAIARHRAQIDAIEIALKLEGPVGPDVAQTVVQGALELALLITRHDAFDLAEHDVLAPGTKIKFEGD